MVLPTARALAVPALAGLAGPAALRAGVLGLDPDDLVGDRIGLVAAAAGDVVHIVPSGDRHPGELEARVAAHPHPVLGGRRRIHTSRTTPLPAGCK